MSLKTFESLLKEAQQGANIDLSVGYSILKDTFKRQNFTVNSANVIGKNKVSFNYIDPDSKNPKKEKNISMKFSIHKIDEKEKDKLIKSIIKQPKLSFTSNKYYQFIRSIVSEMYTSNNNNRNVKNNIAIYDEKQSVNRGAEYDFLVFTYDNDNGDFVDSYTIKIEVTLN